MDLTWSPEELAFREALRTWLAANVPAERRPHDPAAGAAFDRAWQRVLFDAGWAGLNWPREYGGRGLSILQQVIWYEEYVRAGGPPMGFRFVAQNHAGPTLIALGTDDQKAGHLQRILSGEALWCQGFSEPNAGSDLASLRTRGVVDGDELVVTGQKTWTTGADQTDFQELLVRTDPESSRHKGLTWVICPMASKGIEIQPIRKMNGRAEFCSVFYDEVRIPLSNVVGQVNGGWATAMATLGFERGTSFIGEMAEITLRLEELIEIAKASGDWKDDEVRRKLADRRAEVAALRALNYANLSRYARGEPPGAEGSITKLLTNDVARSVHELATEIAGADILDGDLERNRWGDLLQHGMVMTIGGGTPEIQREIIADRVLELPRSR
ncbi:acyl-CoA dehydrogenase family protein [Phenylobacterium sp.]|jgi:alkylation response protein AidB-like acyl-CoA dehydrogenase|uniref:acyl-CoA dehydrogenase family protein n=1 Tax=Phenylobacterium sp. TaxID=1871053 RepID=UPI002ED84C5B